MKELIFYDILKYTYPDKKNKFYLSQDLCNHVKKPAWSKSKKNKQLIDDYINIIKKYWFLYKNIPFVKSIYVCNSLSFCSVKKDSDIDIFIVAKKNRLWLARFWSVLLFTIFGIRRYKEKITKRFCLSFYVTEDGLDLYRIAIKPIDIYLVYWIAHLQPIYIESKRYTNDIFKKNKWIGKYLPNFNFEHVKLLDIDIVIGKGFFKRIVERISWFNFIESCIKYIWQPIIMYKKKKLWKKAKGVSINDKMIKLHWVDIRKDVYLKLKILWKNDNKRNTSKNGSIFSKCKVWTQISHTISTTTSSDTERTDNW